MLSPTACLRRKVARRFSVDDTSRASTGGVTATSTSDVPLSPIADGDVEATTNTTSEFLTSQNDTAVTAVASGEAHTDIMQSELRRLFRTGGRRELADGAHTSSATLPNVTKQFLAGVQSPRVTVCRAHLENLETELSDTRRLAQERLVMLQQQTERTERAIGRAESAEAAATQTNRIIETAITAKQGCLQHVSTDSNTGAGGEGIRDTTKQPGRRHQLYIKPPQFDGTTDVEAYLAKFDRVCHIQSLTDDEAVTIMILSLRGKAESAVRDSEGMTYQQVKDLLRERFGQICTYSSVSRELRHVRWRESQSLQDFAAEVIDIGNKVDMPREQYDILTRHAFVSGLHFPHMAHYIDSHDDDKQHSSVTAALSLARQYIREHGPDRPSAIPQPRPMLMMLESSPPHPHQPCAESPGSVNTFNHFIQSRAPTSQSSPAGSVGGRSPRSLDYRQHWVRQTGCEGSPNASAHYNTQAQCDQRPTDIARVCMTRVAIQYFAPMVLKDTVLESSVSALIDTGSQVTMCPWEVFAGIPAAKRPALAASDISMVGVNQTSITVHGMAHITFTLRFATFTHHMYVVEDGVAAILGADFLDLHDWELTGSADAKYLLLDGDKAIKLRTHSTQLITDVKTIPLSANMVTRTGIIRRREGQPSDQQPIGASTAAASPRSRASQTVVCNSLHDEHGLRMGHSNAPTEFRTMLAEWLGTQIVNELSRDDADDSTHVHIMTNVGCQNECAQASTADREDRRSGTYPASVNQEQELNDSDDGRNQSMPVTLRHIIDDDSEQQTDGLAHMSNDAMTVKEGATQGIDPEPDAQDSNAQAPE